MSAEGPFWETQALDQLSGEQWEAVCDGCGRCCVHKLEDEDGDELYFTNVACRLLDTNSCRCSDYPRRQRRVPDCLSVKDDAPAVYAWLPESCAYRTLAEGRPLAWWHPLVSGRPETVHEAGISVQDKVVSEQSVADEDLEEHIIYWIE